MIYEIMGGGFTTLSFRASEARILWAIEVIGGQWDGLRLLFELDIPGHTGDVVSLNRDEDVFYVLTSEEVTFLLTCV